MESPFVRPLAPKGELGGSALTPSMEVIDGKLLVENWKAIFTKVNGGLTFSSLKSDGELSISEPTQVVLGRTSSVLFAKDAFHTHDGYNSSLLGSDSVGLDQLDYPSSLGVVVNGTVSMRGVTYIGSVRVPVVPASNLIVSGTADSQLCRIPYDANVFGDSRLPFNSTTTGRSKIATQLRFSDGSSPGDITKIQVTTVVTVSGSYMNSLKFRVDNWSNTVLHDVVIDWMVLCLF